MGTMMISRESFTRGAALFARNDAAEVWFHESDRGTVAIGFHGTRAQRPDFNFIFKTRARAETYAMEYLAGQQQSDAARTARQIAAKARRASEMTSLQPGDVLYRSWGYDQTNVDFYEVTEKPSAATAVIVGISAKSVAGSSHGGMSDEVVPLKGSFGDHPSKKIIRSLGDLSLWDGRPKYRSWYA